MDAKLYFRKVHIVEWLPDAAVYRVATRAEFLGVLRGIEGEFRATTRLPELHIETHGDYDWIGVSDAEGFTFGELMEDLIPLNPAVRSLCSRRRRGCGRALGRRRRRGSACGRDPLESRCGDSSGVSDGDGCR